MDPFHVQREVDGRWTSVFLNVMKEKLLFRIQYRNQSQSENWTVQKFGSATEIAEFIERTVPKMPDPALVNAALEELSTKIPEGIL
jgi:hypothetical protein